jgi:hypothetical protein
MQQLPKTADRLLLSYNQCYRCLLLLLLLLLLERNTGLLPLLDTGTMLLLRLRKRRGLQHRVDKPLIC